jgi:hypothetical protein
MTNRIVSMKLKINILELQYVIKTHYKNSSITIKATKYRI